MNQDNNNFELSGTLGSLNNTALNNLASKNPNDTATTSVENNNPIENISTEIETSNEIEMLDDLTPQNLNNNAEVESTTENSLSPNIVKEGNSNENNHDLLVPQPDLNPMPSNFDVGDIGSVPPTDPTGKGEKNPKKKNKVLFIIILIISILAIGALIYYYLHVSKGTIGNAVMPKDLSLELGEELSTDIKDYATFKSISSNNCILNTKAIDINKAGTYKYSITCGTKEYTGKITLKDTLAPEVKTKTIVKKINDTLDPAEFVVECNESTECTYEFENSEVALNNLTQAGTYDLNLIINDTNKNSTTVPVKLIVIDSDIKVYLNCTLSEQLEEGFNGFITLKDKIGISPELAYVGLYFRIKEYVVKTEEEYTKIKNNYIENKVLDINSGIGTPTFDDTNLTIIIEETLSGETDFGTEYSSIKSYYETTKNYKCNLLNVN